ncbi:hypothetical protein [Gordonia jinhuaensis]|nr:hypothetical protein [Gordonia jinhuaensis]
MGVEFVAKLDEMGKTLVEIANAVRACGLAMQNTEDNNTVDLKNVRRAGRYDTNRGGPQTSPSRSQFTTMSQAGMWPGAASPENPFNFDVHSIYEKTRSIDAVALGIVVVSYEAASRKLNAVIDQFNDGVLRQIGPGTHWDGSGPQAIREGLQNFVTSANQIQSELRVAAASTGALTESLTAFQAKVPEPSVATGSGVKKFFGKVTSFVHNDSRTEKARELMASLYNPAVIENNTGMPKASTPYNPVVAKPVVPAPPGWGVGGSGISAANLGGFGGGSGAGGGLSGIGASASAGTSGSNAAKELAESASGLDSAKAAAASAGSTNPGSALSSMQSASQNAASSLSQAADGLSRSSDGASTETMGLSGGADGLGAEGFLPGMGGAAGAAGAAASRAGGAGGLSAGLGAVGGLGGAGALGGVGAGALGAAENAARLTPRMAAAEAAAMRAAQGASVSSQSAGGAPMAARGGSAAKSNDDKAHKPSKLLLSIKNGEEIIGPGLDAVVPVLDLPDDDDQGPHKSGPLNLNY